MSPDLQRRQNAAQVANLVARAGSRPEGLELQRRPSRVDHYVETERPPASGGEEVLESGLTRTANLQRARVEVASL
jgi:hypothetical protein